MTLATTPWLNEGSFVVANVRICRSFRRETIHAHTSVEIPYRFLVSAYCGTVLLKLQ